MTIFDEVGATVAFGGSCAFAGAVATEVRLDADPPVSHDATATFDESLWQAIQANPRWTGFKLVMDGVQYIVSATDKIELDQVMDPATQDTLKIRMVGPLFTIPSQDAIDTPYDPCPSPPQPTPALPSPRLWGNKDVSLWLSFGASPAAMQQIKVFQGVSWQKDVKGDTAILAEIDCIDVSAKYANIPLCYELAPFSGKRRGEITKELAQMVGIDPTTVTCPAGEIVNKPILLSNGSLLQFLAEFWAPELGYPYFDENGLLVVEIIDIKDDPDFTLDASLGDYDLDQFEEIPPTTAPSRIYVTGAIPVGGAPGTGETDIETSKQITEDIEFYNPQCVKVRPSGAPTFLQGDGSYRVAAQQSLMLVDRTTTETTTENGIQTKSVVTTEGWYNPLAYDPNFNTFPAGTSYNDAYGDKTFHRDEAESFMETSRVTTESILDSFGTLQRTVETTMGWYAPQRGMVFHDPNAEDGLINAAPGAYVFAGGTERSQPVETYMVVKRIETSYNYGSDGTIASMTVDTYTWTSPESRCDITSTTITPDTGPTPPPIVSVPPPTYPPPPPLPAPPPPPWYPVMTGPGTNPDGSLNFNLVFPDYSGFDANTPNGVQLQVLGLTFSYMDAQGNITPFQSSWAVVGLPRSGALSQLGTLRVLTRGLPPPKPGSYQSWIVQVQAELSGNVNGFSTNRFFISQPLYFNPYPS